MVRSIQGQLLNLMVLVISDEQGHTHVLEMYGVFR
jgi:hypothetical protein